MFATLRNCSYMFFGINVKMVYSRIRVRYGEEREIGTVAHSSCELCSAGNERGAHCCHRLQILARVGSRRSSSSDQERLGRLGQPSLVPGVSSETPF